MGKYILKRLLMLVFVIIGVVILVFTLLYFTKGDPARQILGPTADEAAVEALREEMGLNDGHFVRLGRYLYNLFFKFDLGNSYRNHYPVMHEVLSRFPITMLIGGLGLIVSVIIGVLAGIVSAVKQYTLIDQIFDSVDDLLAGKMVCGAGGGGFLQVVMKKSVSKEQLQARLKSVFSDTDINVWDCTLV